MIEAAPISTKIIYPQRSPSGDSFSGMEHTRQFAEASFTSEELDTNAAEGVINGYWGKRTSIVVLEMMADDKVGKSKEKGLSKLEQEREKLHGFIATTITGSEKTAPTGKQLDTFFTILDWYDKNPEQDSEQLIFAGINPSELSPLIGNLLSLAKYYVEKREIDPIENEEGKRLLDEREQIATTITQQVNKTRGEVFSYNPDIHKQALIAFSKEQTYGKSRVSLTQTLEQTSQWLLEQKVGSSDIPFSFDWFSQREEEGMIPPSWNTMVEFNKGVLEGREIHLYCCPNYATERRDDGTVVYTFESLGTGIGLTAEKGFPFIENIIRRIQQMQKAGIDIANSSVRIGIADYEATQANADLVKMSLTDFKAALGASVQAMTAHMQKAFGDHVQMVGISEEAQPTTSLTEHTLLLRDGKAQTTITFGGIASLHADEITDGATNFARKVEATREKLVKQSQTDKVFQRKLEKLLKLRLGLLLRWRDGTEPEMIQHLGNLYDTVSQGEFATPIDNFSEFNGMVTTINGIIENKEYDENEKDEVIKAIIVNWMVKNSSNEAYPQVKEGLTYVRERVAAQGAEYMVMSQEIKRRGGMHVTADSAPMWQAYGEEEVTRSEIRGGYEGA